MVKLLEDSIKYAGEKGWNAIKWVDESVRNYGPSLNSLRLNKLDGWVGAPMKIFLWEKVGNYVPGEMQRDFKRSTGIEDDRYFASGITWNATKNAGKFLIIYLAMNHQLDDHSIFHSTSGWFAEGGLFDAGTYFANTTADFFGLIGDYSVKVTKGLLKGGTGLLATHAIISTIDLFRRTGWYVGNRLLRGERRPTSQWTSEGIYHFLGGKETYKKTRNKLLTDNQSRS